MTEAQKQELKKRLWAVANILRGRMDADEYRDYILGFIFYKHLSEKIEDYANKLLRKDKLAFTEIKERTADGKAYLKALEKNTVEGIGYFLPPSRLFKTMAERSGLEKDPKSFILDDLGKVFETIEKSARGTDSEGDFDQLFEDIVLDNSRLGRDPKMRNDIIGRILRELNGISFRQNEASGDILGDAYEYLIGEFAAAAGKKAGEFYTPQEVSTVLTRLVCSANGGVKKRLKSVYDPTCGSGSLLLRFGREVNEVGQYYGQEMNRTTYNLARMNMILHDVSYRDFNLHCDDVIRHPAQEYFDERFEAVVANPPFSAKWSPSQVFKNDDRFSSFDLPPASKADYCFVLHMLHHLADRGIMAVILPHGALFRGASEGRIRTQLIEQKNWLDAVIGLPANVFYGTSIPVCLLVFKKCREAEDDILFIDASQGFEKVRNRNILRDADVDRIVDAYRDRKARKRFARPVPLKEVAANDFNLNIPRYIDTSEPEEEIDLKATAQDLKRIDKDLQNNAKEIAAFCKELGIAPPV
ncbi:MAG: type I restriction-modification system subunit M [Pseudomonadota bacterium]